MGWMARHAERRADPRALWPEARTVVAVAASYAPKGDPLATLARRDRAAISVYAQGRDYHDVLKKRLKRLAGWMAATHACAVKVFVDTAPVMEKPLAARAGVGWQGKHTNLVSRDFGSWLFLGEVFTTLELAPDGAMMDHCGSCDACRQACPTGALPEPYRIDPGRCISYLTIELKSAIPVDLRPGVGDWILGCDVCQEVCPWNRRAAATREAAFHARDGLDPVDLLALLGMDRDAFNERFRRNPAKRPKRRGMLRNAAVALGNSGQRQVVPALSRSLHEEPEALVRAHVAWALGQLGGDDARAALAAARQTEPEASVREEIDAALQADG